MAVLPMFPLGSVLLPSLFLPLHVFEPRYRALVHECLLGDREFGVVLIERGSEVGGGDLRTRVGTVARILEAVELPDRRWAIGAVGDRRIRVVEWLDDDPYPRAEVADWPDPDADDVPGEAIEQTVALLRRVLARTAELGDPAAPATQELADEPGLALFQAVAVSPFGPSDRQRLLEAPSAAERVELLDRLLREEDEFLLQRLALGSVDDDGSPAADPDTGPA